MCLCVCGNVWHLNASFTLQQWTIDETATETMNRAIHMVVSLQLTIPSRLAHMILFNIFLSFCTEKHRTAEPAAFVFIYIKKNSICLDLLFPPIWIDSFVIEFLIFVSNCCSTFVPLSLFFFSCCKFVQSEWQTKCMSLLKIM